MGLEFIFLLVVGCVENAGPIPVDYGRPCDPEQPGCSDGMDCVRMGDHLPIRTGVAAEEYGCSMPCESPADCPRRACLVSAGSQEPYGCASDGYCMYIACTNNEWP